ncbi:MAG: bifunctional diaminohydroxyphosphoribosylaminopyrimidine deaminase/5-amino-6-(5-phosphoribosylamino)uracil reductase RibD [Acidobacteriota bacterium]
MTWSALLGRALELAEQGRFGASPNPMVGALVLDAEGAVVGEGAHLRCGGPHAEVVALGAAAGRARGGTLVVTLEPCAHHGRTPPCVEAIRASGIRRVVVGVRDPNPLVDGRGIITLRDSGIEVIEGIEEEACRALNRRFFHWVTSGLPFVTLKMAMTMDGKLAARGGRSRWITSEPARREGYALREEHDALLVGANTVLADDPRLLRHLGLNPNPHLRRIVLDSALRTPPGATLLQQLPEDVVFFCIEDAPGDRRRSLEDAGAAVVVVGDDGRGRCDLRQVLRWLGGQHVSSVLVEGGGEVHWSFLHEGLAQRVHAFIAPLVLGGREAVHSVGGAGFASPQEAVRLAFVEIRRLAEDLVVVAEVQGV